MGATGLGLDAASPAWRLAADAELRGALRTFVGRRTGGHADGDDIVQDVWLRLSGYDAGALTGSLRALCFAIARNLLVDRARTAARRAGAELDETIACPQPLPDTVLAYARAVELLVVALGRMPPLRRGIFLRKRLDGDSAAAIAGALEMSVAAVEKHVVRASSDLRRAMAQRGFTIEGGA